VGIITSGVVHGYALEAMKMMEIKASVLKLGMCYPLPEKKLTEFITGIKKLFVVEEVEPFIELQVRSLAKDVNQELEIFGKTNGYFPLPFEYDSSKVVKAISKALDLPMPIQYDSIETNAEKLKELVFARPPVLCAGCPHRASAYAVKRATKSRAFFIQDIGCYALSTPPPLAMGDLEICMGSSLTFASGLSYFSESPIISVIGDSTFFHSGLTGLANAVYNQADLTLLILDNGVTGMTGFQPNPATGVRGGEKPGQKLIIENVVKGMGVEDLKIIDSFNYKELRDGIKDSVAFKGVSVIISRRECAILSSKKMKEAGLKPDRFKVDPEECNGCWLCIDRFGCPPIEKDGEVARIVPEACVGCGVCAQICPSHAIVEVN
jgi:indolepyruvate ferredoxin oxidoreductase alpha subunit